MITCLYPTDDGEPCKDEACCCIKKHNDDDVDITIPVCKQHRNEILKNSDLEILPCTDDDDSTDELTANTISFARFKCQECGKVTAVRYSNASDKLQLEYCPTCGCGDVDQVEQDTVRADMTTSSDKVSRIN